MSQYQLVLRGHARRQGACLERLVLSSLALFFGFSVMLIGAEISAPNATVGRNLQVQVHLSLSGVAPEGGLKVKLTSDQPQLLLLSKTPDTQGSPEITLPIGERQNASRDFYLQALGNRGTATYTVAVSGSPDVKGTVTLAPSGIVIAGPAKLGNPLLTTSGGQLSRITVYAAQLSPAGAFVIEQQVRGGFSAKIHLTSSNPSLATIPEPDLVIEGGYSNAITDLQPAGPGSVQVSASVPEGFTAPTQFATLTAQMRKPAMAVTQHINIGHNLQVGGYVILGELAPPAGVSVTLTSNDPGKLLLAQGGLESGVQSITVKIPPRGANASFVMQGIGDSGTATYTATAPGFETRVGTINLTPSGVIITGPTGTPDEAELFRPKDPVGANGFFTKTSDPNPVQVVVYTMQLDPVTHRCADITVQPLRIGVSLTAELKSDNTAVGTIPSSVTIKGGDSQGITQFKPHGTGTAILSVNTPAGFTTPTNATALKAVVKE